MSELITVEQVRKVREGLTAFTDNVLRKWSTDEVISQCMDMRHYNSQEMYNTLKEVGLFKCDYLSELTYFAPDITTEQMQEWGLLTENGDFILQGRYAVPIRDISDEVTALVGWFPDSRKYITTPTIGFARDAQFFNIECYKDYVEQKRKSIFVVEGIFDTLSLRSLGFSALGNMGLQMSAIKVQMLKRFGKVIAIPDNDKAGRSVCPYTNSLIRGKKDFTWKIQNDCVFVQLPKGVKDIDDFVKEFDCVDDLKNCENFNLLRKLRED